MCLDFGHVQVVNEDDTALWIGRGEDSLSSLLKCTVDDVLNHIALGLC